MKIEIVVENISFGVPSKIFTIFICHSYTREWKHPTGFTPHSV